MSFPRTRESRPRSYDNLTDSRPRSWSRAGSSREGHADLFVRSPRQRDAIKLAAVGGGEDKLLGAGVPCYDAVFVVVILCWVTEELRDALDRAVVCCSVLLDTSRFCDEGNSRDILSGSINAKLPGVIEINSIECIEICILFTSPLQRIDRGVSVEKNFGGDHAGMEAVHVERLWGLRGGDEWEQKCAKK
jgi:hypothetical protein